MAFWQTNTGFKVWIGTNPFNTWFNSGFSSNSGTNNRNSTTKNNKKSYDDTYNPRYPWFNEEDYKRLERMVDEKGLTWWEKTDTMDQLYQVYLPQVLNRRKLDERQQEINDSVYKNWEALLNWDKEVTMWTALTKLAQEAKKKYNIPYNVNDNELIKDIVADTENGNKLLYEYTQNWNPEIFYAAWIWDRPQQQEITWNEWWVQRWWVKSLINEAWNDNTWIVAKKWEWLNPIGATTETLDNAAKFADRWLARWSKALDSTAENLRNKVENMSPEEVERYRKQYQKLLKDKDWRVGQVQGDTIVEQLWNGIKWNISYDYNDEDFIKWVISQKANLWESLTWADDFLNWESDPNVVQLFANIPSSALKTFTATVRGMTNPYDTAKWLYYMVQDVADKGFKDSVIWQRYWSWDAFAKALNEDPVWVADDALAVAEIVSWVVWWASKWIGKVTGNQGLIDFADNVKSLNIWSANDALAQKTVWGIYWWLDKAASMTDNKLVQWANRYVQDVSSLSKIVTDWKEVYDRAKETTPIQRARNFMDEVIDKTVWIDKADREFIMNNKEIVDDYVSGKKNVETVLEEVKNKIDEKQLSNSQMGKEYEAIREKGQTVNTEALASDMVEKLNKNKITINADWDLEFDKLSKYNTAQQKALQDAWQVIKDAQAAWNLDAGTILDLRQKFDDKVNWTWKPTELRNMSSVDKATESLIKEMRSTIDTRAKWWIDWLKEIDEKYAPALEEMREIKRDWFDSNGNLKDNARSKLRNLTKAWNEEKLARLEKVAPWITQDLKALDVAQTIDRVTKQTVWEYTKGNLIAQWIWGAALFQWNIPGAIVGLWFGILATPKNFIKLLEAYPDIVAKISAWQELLPSDMNKLQSLASRIQDGME